MLVTILSGRREEAVVRRRGPERFEVLSAPSRLPARPGWPLEILALSLPFAVCSRLAPGRTDDEPLIVDLREVRLCRISESFVAAVASYEPRPKDEDSDDVSGPSGLEALVDDEEASR